MATQPYSGLDDPGTWVLPAVLIEQAERHPDRLWIRTTTGESATFAQMRADVDRMAGHLAQLGLGAGEPVAVMLPNGLDFVRVWLGLGRCAAVAVLLNTELTGAFLAHPLTDCGAEVAVVHASLLPAFLAVAAQAPQLRRVLVVGGLDDALGATEAPGPTLLDLDRWRESPPFTGPLPRAQDLACVMYTSGTSGPAKGVQMPHAHCFLYGRGAIDALQVTAEDRYYIVLPLFHANGLLMQLGATLIAGCEAVVRPRFSASAWLEDLRRTGATITYSLGAVAAFVVAQPPTARDREHRLRAMMCAPNLAEHEAVFRSRFGIPDVTSGYGMTEVNMPVWGRIGESLPGAAGRVYARFFELQVVDPETDQPMPPDTLGEVVVRPRVPFGFMAGYLGRPQQTVEAWRNLWFHTGDAGLLSADGVLTFVDRIKDCIRRRGENISATEIESAVGSLDGVAEVAACAVPSDIPGGEDEVMLVVVAAPGASLSPEAVIAHADAVLPRFAQARYVAIQPELPRTATGKVQRAALRRQGPGSAWDRHRKDGA